MKKWFKTLWIYIMIFVLVAGMAYIYSGGQSQDVVKEVEFSDFVLELQNENVKELTVIGTSMSGTLQDGSKISAFAPSEASLLLINQTYIMPQISAGTLVVTSEPPVTTPWYITMLPYFITIILFVVIWFVFMNQSQGGAGKAMSFGRSKAKLHKDSDGRKVTFKDVAGLEEEKAELEEIVDFLKRPKKYVELGARIPKGVLLVGPPGTGKTYISKATAGEAGVPFFSISGSDFVEMFVGVGASRVRDLFEQAKKNSPCIIFIDEIDAVGRRRGAGLGGGHDEREQTLNQMLVEMDGFGMNEGVIVFAATNRPDILDPALLRPGRFDRQILIGLPDVRGREDVFQTHSKNKPIDPTVDLKILAKRTPGFSPADIENVLNEAALLTARRNGKSIKMEEMEEAITKVLAGPEKKSRVISDKERKLTAYHEAGHAVVARSLPDSDPVHQVTIIPRGRAGGFTMTLPKEDRNYETKSSMTGKIIHLLGGRVAEKLVLGDISTGASNDIERATEIARNMITKYGMSDLLGTINYSESDEVFLGKDLSTKRNYSEETAHTIDMEVKRLIDSCFKRAEEILSEQMDKLATIAEALLEIETLDAAQFESLYSGEKTKEEITEEIKLSIEQKERRIARQKQDAEAEERARLEKAFYDDIKKSMPQQHMPQKSNGMDVVFKKVNHDELGRASEKKRSDQE